jgi:hypothetical protein
LPMISGEMQLTGRWAREGELELAGRLQDIAWLAEQLGQVTEVLAVDLRDITPAAIAPYDGGLRHLSLRPAPGSDVVIRSSGDELSISGDPSKLRILADNLASFAGTSHSVGQHLHIEHYPDHFYLASESQPLVVVALADEGSAKDAGPRPSM